MFKFLDTSWDFSLANYGQVWSFLSQIGLLLMFLLMGNVLRRKIPLFKKCLIPSALLGGALLLIVDLIGQAFGHHIVNNRIMQVITYHALGIGFAATTLKSKPKKIKISKSQVLENGFLQGGTYMLQAFTGLLLTIILFLVTKNSDKIVSYVSGLLLPLSYGQGPANALVWDNNFTNVPAAMFDGSGSFGLSLASIGFIVASVVGVIYIYVFKKKGVIRIEEEKKEIIDLSNLTGNEIPDNESIDKFSVQMGFVAFAYAIAFGIMCLLAVISDFTNSIAWGFNFIWAVIGATLIKVAIKLLRKSKLMNRDYINNYQMDRISGVAFDLMIVAGVSAIEIRNIANYILPIVILAVIGCITTFIYIRAVAKHCYKGYEHEFFLMNFGTLTGTASNGMILLKEIDPNLKTPTSNLYILSTFYSTLFVAPLLFLLAFSAKSLNNAIIACIIFFVLWFVYTAYLFRRKIFKKKYANKPVEVWKEE